jgi:3-hydroxyisobutyrate dehydrogenase-like beta-hydroxyacid dehydrogenase
MHERIGFIGLGQLGLPVAMNLLAAGYRLQVYNRTASKAQVLVEQGAQQVARPVEAISPGGVVVTLVWDDAALESIVRSEGFLTQLGDDGIHLSLSTIQLEAAKRLADLHAHHGSLYIEAPIFGRPEAAAARQLWFSVAGPARGKERVYPLLQAMGGQGIFDFGEAVGAATTVKIAGNFLIIAAAHALQEAVAMAKENGVPPHAIIDMLTQSLFPAPIYKAYGKMIAENTLPFGQSQIPLKDIRLFREAAEGRHVPTPLAHLLETRLHNDATEAQARSTTPAS